jgi:saxitoxin biosynthesis operon SxtJ-like protein
MRWSDVTAIPTDRQLRQFAVIGAAALMLLAVWRFSVLGAIILAAGCATAAVVVGLIGLARPRWLAPVFTFWLIVAFPIAWLISHLVLAIIYFGLITPLGLLFRACGRDALDRAWPGRQDTFWRDKPAADQPQRYLRQY